MAGRAAFEEEQYAELRAAGRRLRLDEAVALALGVSVPDPGSLDAAHAVEPVGAATLTSREREVLHFLVAGRTDREIAASLFIGHRTVQDHVSNILHKLSVVNRTEAAAVAQRDGLV
jgi:DNA-binding NarL/FixJ family response regulator